MNRLYRRDWIYYRGRRYNGSGLLGTVSNLPDCVYGAFGIYRYGDSIIVNFGQMAFNCTVPGGFNSCLLVNQE